MSPSGAMGILEQTDTQQRFTLNSRCLLGRHPFCDIRVDDARVSGEHAVLHWRGDGWELKDMDSRNGTFLNGKQLEKGERPLLKAGDSFLLALHGPRFRLVDSSPPAARARNLATQEVRETSGSLLVLPNDEAPLASLFLDGSGRWVLESGDVQRHVLNQERVKLGEAEWVLELPLVAAETLEVDGPALDRVHLRIGVSRHQEYVEVTVIHGGQQHVLPPRAYHYLLVILARLRLEQQGLSEAEQGWVDRELLCQMLATDMNKLNVDIHRVRRQISALGIPDAAGVVERRPGTGEVRLGIRSVEVLPL